MASRRSALPGSPAVGALLVLGSVVSPRMVLLLTVGAALLVFFVTHVDLAILLVVASAPLEGAFASGPAGISVTKLAGCALHRRLRLTRWSRTGGVLVFEPGQALVLGLLGIALLSTAWAEHSSAAITTTTRYASFAAIYVIITQFGARPRAAAADRLDADDHVLDRRGLGLNDYLNGSDAQLATLQHAQTNDFAFILATSLPFMFFLLGRTRALRPLLLGAIGLVSAAILLSLSRGAFVGLAAGFMLFVLTDRRRLQVTLTAGARRGGRDAVRDPQQPAALPESLVLKQTRRAAERLDPLRRLERGRPARDRPPAAGRRARELPVPLQRPHRPAARDVHADRGAQRAARRRRRARPGRDVPCSRCTCCWPSSA